MSILFLIIFKKKVRLPAAAAAPIA